ncbi:MAG TPA: tRNA (adenosine(37)-N6)-threonylcarbamoyltransferase complex dimerization subunit type 1 TsaB [Streptosporangiaceae bacterium]
MLLLAFDTATPAVTVALHDGARIVAAESAVDARRQGELLSPFIDRALASAGAGRGDLTAIAVGTGPGPYTGLRAGLVTARVLGSALGLPVDGWGTLDVIAAAVVAPGGEFLVATDARRKELYWARYSAARERIGGPAVCPAGDLAPGLPVAGEGAVLYPDLGAEPIAPRYPDAACLAALSAKRILAGGSPSPAEPLYLRRPDAREPGQRKRVTP